MKAKRFSLLPLLAVVAAILPVFSADVEIVLPPGANAVERTAAQELAAHWKKVTDGAAETVTAATGKARWTFRLGRAAPLGLEGLGKNCAKVRISGDGVVDIAGVDGDAAMKESTSAGTLFGVYGFLERKLGVRWLWPGELGTVCPKRKDISLAAEEWTERHMAFATWRASANVKSPGWKDKAAARKFYSEQSLWLRRHRFAACDRLAKGHAFTSWFKEYGKTHPEWFNEMPDGTRRGDPFYFGGRADIISLCASNRELVREIVRRWAEKDPTDIINGNENDTAGKCCCPNCLAADATGDDAGRLARAAAAFSAKSNGWWRALGSESTRYAAFWRAILEEGRKVRPDCRVIGCVYANYSDPPAAGTVLGENVILRFCPPVMYPWTDEKVAFFKNTWEGWSATGAKLMMRPNFTLDGHNFPLAYYRRYADCYDFVRAHGLVAVDMDSLTGAYGSNGLTTYVIASKNSSPERPLAALEDDYFSAFGSSAAVVRECYAQFEKASEAGFGKADPDDMIEGGRYCDFMLSAYRVFPPAMLEGACARLSAAMAAEKDPLVVRRLAFVKTGLEDALLVLKSQRGFAEYQKTRDRTLFSSAYAELLAFRRRNEGLGYQNLATVDFYESRHWPRHLGLLGPSARELDGWELNLNPDPAVGSWVPQKKLHQWRADYNGIGWYRCRFTLSADEARRFNRLVFGAVDGLPTVHLNGKVVQDGHPIPEPGLAWRTPFTVENVDAFKAGENELLIKIDKKVPGRRGINRPVYLDCRPGPPAQKSNFAKGVALMSCAASATFAVPPSWPEATRDSKPWVYNWWMGCAVDEKGLEAQCAALAEKGFGGFHVIPIYGAKGYENQYRSYLSDEWMKAFADAVRIAAAHGLDVDMTTGCGWCFGGPQISATNGCWKLRKRSDGTPPYIEPALTRQQVKRAGLGGKGPMMDPFSTVAMDEFLKPFTAAFGKPGAVRPIRMYHDSFEYYDAGWTPQFLERFKAKRGYDLSAHWDAFAGGKGDPNLVARLKCDYRETLSDLMIEDVFPKWVDWCHARGIQTRNEAHGSPANWLDFYALSDCPETEMFGRDNRDVLISKFASSAAHVAGQTPVSAEACTWLNEHFCETPLDYKRMLDLLLVSGVNRIYYHGCCYSPPDAVWPGWCFYASSETNPRNPLWHDFDAINAYVTRIQSVMQASVCDNDLLIYWPLHDLWTDASGFERRMSVHRTEWFDAQPFGRIARMLHEMGCQFDYVSDRQLKRLRFGARSYRTILVPPVRAMPLATAQALVRLAEEGFEVVFAGGFPETVPGFFEYEKQSEQLRSLFADPPKRMARCECADLLKRLRVEPFTHAAGLSAWRRKAGDTTYYFIVNERPSAVEEAVRLASPAAAIWEMDLMTGRVRGARRTDGRAHLSLGPYGSVILAASAKPDAGDSYTAPPKTRTTVVVGGPWTLKPLCGGPAMPPERTMRRLSSWSTGADGQEEPFCGTMRYRTTFSVEGGEGQAACLDLGEVCHSARVRLNGRDLGCCFIPPYRFEIPSGVLRQENDLEVEVTNLGANRIRWNDRKGIYWKRFHDVNMLSVTGVWSGGAVPFNATDWPLRESGLLGPVSVELR